MNHEQQKESRTRRALKETSEIWDAWKGKIAMFAIAATVVGGGTAATANKAPSNPKKAPNTPEELGEQGNQSASLADGGSVSVQLANGENVTITAKPGETTPSQSPDQVIVHEGDTEAGQPTVQVTAEHK